MAAWFADAAHVNNLLRSALSAQNVASMAKIVPDHNRQQRSINGVC
jgi:hypothetical protein